jgi:hypothetical protein
MEVARVGCKNYGRNWPPFCPFEGPFGCIPTRASERILVRSPPRPAMTSAPVSANKHRPAGMASRDDLRTLFWVFIWLGGLHVVITTAVVALLCVPHPGAVTVLAGLALFSYLPVARPFTAWQTALAAHIAQIANTYFPVTLQVSEATRRACEKGVKTVVGARMLPATQDSDSEHSRVPDRTRATQRPAHQRHRLPPGHVSVVWPAPGNGQA